MPAEPEPEAEKEEASERHRHEGPEEVRQGGPLGTADQPDALPDEERPDDPEPPNDRDRPHTRHLRGHRDRRRRRMTDRTRPRRLPTLQHRRPPREDAGFGRLIHHVPLSRSPSLPIHRGRGRSTWNEFTNGRRAIIAPGPTPSRMSRSSAAWTPRTSSASWTTSSTRSMPSSKRTPRS